MPFTAILNRIRRSKHKERVSKRIKRESKKVRKEARRQGKREENRRTRKKHRNVYVMKVKNKKKFKRIICIREGESYKKI